MIRLAPDAAGLERAQAELLAGGVIAFPTDTAYGLGVLPHPPPPGAQEGDTTAAPPSAPAAVVDPLAAIYALKGRPAHLPLILLAAHLDDFAGWAELTGDALELARRFWPGPLTLVVKAGPKAPPRVATPEGTVGIRIPAHPAAQALLALTGPLATTSANRSGQASPRSADDVAEQLGQDPLLALLLDAGPTRHDADSTVLSMVGVSRILRQGALSRADLGLPPA